MARIGLRPPTEEVQQMEDPWSKFIQEFVFPEAEAWREGEPRGGPYAVSQPPEAGFPEPMELPEDPLIPRGEEPTPGFGIPEVVRQPTGTPYHQDLTSEEARQLPHEEYMRYLAHKYGGPQAGIYGPGEYRGEELGGQRLDVQGGGTVTIPTGQGVDLEMLYVIDKEQFQQAYPALVTEAGEFDQNAYKRVQAAKAGIGDRPSDSIYRDVDYTDRTGFENALIKQLGGIDPRTYNPMSEMESETTANLPALFRHIFQGKVAWNDRGSLNEQQNKYWLAVKNAYRAQTLERFKMSHNNAKFGYEEGMKAFDQRAGKHFAGREKAAKAEAAKFKPSDWRANRASIAADYKTTTLGDVMHQQPAKNLVVGAQHLYDKVRREGQFRTPLEARNYAVKVAENMVNRYWEIRDKLDEEKEADKIAKLDKLMKDNLNYVPKSKIIHTK